MCQQYDTSNWDSTAPQKLILICFAEEEDLNTPTYLSYYQNMFNVYEEGSKGDRMQKYINTVISTLSRIEEHHSNSLDNAQSFFETELSEIWSQSRVQVINIVWIKQLGDNEYKHIAGDKKFVDCNPF